MRRFLTVLAIMTLPLLAFAAGEKVVDRSAKKAPSWLYGMEQGFIITTAEGSTMEIARDLAMQQVKERILASIAEHIEAETSMSVQERATESDIEALSTFSKQIKSKTANIPFVNDVSESHVADYYWEKVEVEKKKYVFRYNIKYPLSSLQIRKIIADFKQHEAEINAQLETFSKVDFANCSSTDEMAKAFTSLNEFIKTLPEGDSRLPRCRAIGEKYKKMLDNLHIVVAEVSRQFTLIEMRYGGTLVSCSQTPKLKSDCLSAMQYRVNGDGGRITYDFETSCYPGELNELIITFTIAGKKITTKVYVK